MEGLLTQIPSLRKHWWSCNIVFVILMHVKQKVTFAEVSWLTLNCILLAVDIKTHPVLMYVLSWLSTKCPILNFLFCFYTIKDFSFYLLQQTFQLSHTFSSHNTIKLHTFIIWYNIIFNWVGVTGLTVTAHTGWQDLHVCLRPLTHWITKWRV